MEEKGTISIHSENIFPIIKKFLYSDHEIFLRELVSNAVDATEKIQQLAKLGEYSGELGETKIKISINKEAKTVTVSDKGIGMTADEIKKYINQIAFSGAEEFVEKYKDKADTQQIIGHFGLGFYSSFMVASKVEIITSSYQEGAEAAKWECDGSTEFEISDADKKDRGTDVVLHIAEDSEEFLEPARIKGILDKYCRFLPVEIEFEENVINNPQPAWTKAPTELKDEDYLNFYKELYPFSDEPLFWIHLNVDYPFNLTGILYFPKIKNELELQKNKIQLYSRQVFITDEVKDVVPEFLMLLHGVIDSPDIPLNVSRSYLQSDSNVKKINAHITKKVADKLGELYKNDRKSFEDKWSDINVFVKYGMVSEDKFYDKAKDFCLLSSTDGSHHTIEEYKEKIAANQTDKDGNVVALYTISKEGQHTFIQSAKKRGYDVIELSGPLDSHFINLMEQKIEKFQLKRVDADSIEKLIEKDEKKESVLSEDEKKKVEEIYKAAIGNDTIKIDVESLPEDELPVTITYPEFMRRMNDMAAMQGGMNFMANMENQFTVVLNGNHPVMQKLLKIEDADKSKDVAKQTYDLALLSQGMLTGESLTSFINRSVDIATS